MKTIGALAAAALASLATATTGCATEIEASGRNPRLVASLEAADWGEERPLRLSDLHEGSAPAPESGDEPAAVRVAPARRPVEARPAPVPARVAYRRDQAARRPAPHGAPSPLVVQAERAAVAAARRPAAVPAAAPAPAAPLPPPIGPPPIGPPPMTPVVARALEPEPAAPVPPPSADAEWAVRIAVAGASGPDAALREPLLARVREIPGVSEAAWVEGPDTIRVAFRGDPASLLARLAQVSGPSLVLGAAELHVPATVRDDTPPSPKIFDPVEGAAIASARIAVGVLVPDDDVAEVDVNGVAATKLPDQKVWRADVPCTEGANVLTAVARDRAGNEGRDSVRVGVDTTPPDVTADAVIRVHGRVDDPASRVTVNGKAVEVRPDGSYETLVALTSDGRVIVEATDSLGNKTTRVLEFGGR